jgi:16S rRNA (uracil1498-N3)-methyltransferase
MITVLAPPGSITAGAALPLSAEEAHHLEVLRLEPAEELRVIDGAGAIGWGKRVGAGAMIAVERVERVAPPAVTVLAAGAGDKDRFLVLVEKAVELGATRIVPLETEHSRSVATRIRDKHREKLVQRAQQALKQSRNPWLPMIDEPMAVDELLATDLPVHRWLADAAGALPVGLGRGDGLALAIGPEGGFTQAERVSLVRAGFAPVTLGPYVLRFDTAAVAALTLAAHLRSRDPA